MSILILSPFNSVQAISLFQLELRASAIILAPQYVKIFKKPTKKIQRLSVIATAYTSHVNQTDSTPNIAAWGDRLKPGMQAIAVSRDLLNKYDLQHGSTVRIKNLGTYTVLDKMNRRWTKRIDIYMGKDIKKARQWGKRPVIIEWESKPPTTP